MVVESSKLAYHLLPPGPAKYEERREQRRRAWALLAFTNMRCSDSLLNGVELQAMLCMDYWPLLSCTTNIQDVSDVAAEVTRLCSELMYGPVVPRRLVQITWCSKKRKNHENVRFICSPERQPGVYVEVVQGKILRYCCRPGAETLAKTSNWLAGHSRHLYRRIMEGHSSRDADRYRFGQRITKGRAPFLLLLALAESLSPVLPVEVIAMIGRAAFGIPAGKCQHFLGKCLA